MPRVAASGRTPGTAFGAGSALRSSAPRRTGLAHGSGIARSPRQPDARQSIASTKSDRSASLVPLTAVRWARGDALDDMPGEHHGNDGESIHVTECADAGVERVPQISATNQKVPAQVNAACPPSWFIRTPAREPRFLHRARQRRPLTLYLLPGWSRVTVHGGSGGGSQPTMVRTCARAVTISGMSGNRRRSSTAAESSPPSWKAVPIAAASASVTTNIQRAWERHAGRARMHATNRHFVPASH